jgi:hypothetical protein
MSHGPYKEYLVDGAELSCSACGSHNSSVPSNLPAPINGGFYIHRTNTKRVTIQRKLVCTEEDKKLISKAPIYCMNTGMPCTPILDEWINPRGRAANVKTGGHHFLLDDAKIKCKKGGGILNFINSGQVMNQKTSSITFISISSKLREAGFALFNPRKAYAIGQYERGSSNISTIAVLFASNIGLPEPERKEGSHINAFRHALWQAIITSEYGENISSEVGNSHEENPSFLKQIFDTSHGGLVVSSLLEISIADEIVDLHNNIIGRKLGYENAESNNSELAEKLLSIFKESGLFIAEKHANTIYYKVIKENINQETLDKAIYSIRRGLDSNNKERQNNSG